MPSHKHQYQEEELLKYFKNEFPNYLDQSVYEYFGSWSKSLADDIKEFKIYEDITKSDSEITGNNSKNRYVKPDLLIRKKNNELIFIGEAKQMKDFLKNGDLKPRSERQLEIYIRWLKKSKDNYHFQKLIYSVPTFYIKSMENNIRKLMMSNNIDFKFLVFCWYDEIEQ